DRGCRCARPGRSRDPAHAAARVGAAERVKPAPFEYARPESIEEAVLLLAKHGPEAKVLAGGQSLVPMLNMRLARPSVLIDINRLPLGDIVDDDGLRRGRAPLPPAPPRPPRPPPPPPAPPP